MRILNFFRVSPSSLLACITFGITSVGCTSTPQPIAQVSAKAPPKDDGTASKGGNGGLEHAASLEQLKAGTLVLREDQQRSIRFPLPDGANWTRVKFWSVKSLVGFRYGKEHHAIGGAFITHTEGPHTVEACRASFEKWATPYMEAFEVELEKSPSVPFTLAGQPAEVEVVLAKTATIIDHEQYAAAFAILPAWNNACIIAGIAVPARGEVARAIAVRDRLANEILPKIEVLAKTEPKDLY